MSARSAHATHEPTPSCKRLTNHMHCMTHPPQDTPPQPAPSANKAHTPHLGGGTVASIQLPNELLMFNPRRPRRCKALQRLLHAQPAGLAEVGAHHKAGAVEACRGWWGRGAAGAGWLTVGDRAGFARVLLVHLAAPLPFRLHACERLHARHTHARGHGRPCASPTPPPHRRRSGWQCTGLGARPRRSRRCAPPHQWLPGRVAPAQSRW